MMVIITIIAVVFLVFFTSGQYLWNKANVIEFNKEKEKLEQKNKRLSLDLRDATVVNRRLIDESMTKRVRDLNEKNNSLCREIEKLNSKCLEEQRLRRQDRKGFEEQLELANRYKIYKFTLKDIGDNSSCPRSAVITSYSVESAAAQLLEEMHDLFKDARVCHILSIYSVEEVDRNQSSVVLVNMDVF